MGPKNDIHSYQTDINSYKSNNIKIEHLTLDKLTIQISLCIFQTKLSIKFSVLFYALVLMLLTKFVPNSTTRRCSLGIIVLNLDAKS